MLAQCFHWFSLGFFPMKRRDSTIWRWFESFWLRMGTGLSIIISKSRWPNAQICFLKVTCLLWGWDLTGLQHKRHLLKHLKKAV